MIPRPTQLCLPLDNAQDAQRGNFKTLCPGDKTTVCEFKNSCTFGTAIAVVLSARAVPDNDTREPLKQDEETLPLVRAHLQWGIGGTTFYASCDVLLGTCIVLPAECVKVDVEYLVLGCDECPSTACLPKMRVDVGFAYYGVGRNSNSARYTDLVCVPAGEKRIVQIPQFAISWTALSADGDGNVIVRAFGFGSDLRFRYDIASPATNAGQTNVENAFPVYNGERFLEIDNEQGADPKRVLFIFGLAF